MTIANYVFYEPSACLRFKNNVFYELSAVLIVHSWSFLVFSVRKTRAVILLEPLRDTHTSTICTWHTCYWIHDCHKLRVLRACRLFDGSKIMYFTSFPLLSLSLTLCFTWLSLSDAQDLAPGGPLVRKSMQKSMFGYGKQQTSSCVLGLLKRKKMTKFQPSPERQHAEPE